MPSYELSKLLNHYGVANASKPAYAGAAMPTDPSAADYQALLDKYNADNTAYTDWAKEYDQRMQTPMYGPAYQGAPLQALAYKYGPQTSAGPAAQTPAAVVNPAADNVLSSTGGSNNGGFGAANNGFVGNPNSLTGGLLGAMIGQDPTGVDVSDRSSMSLGAMSEGAQAAANAGLSNQAAAGMTGFGGVGTDPSVGGFGGLGGVGGMSDAGDMGGMQGGYGDAMGGMSDSSDSSDSGDSGDSGGDSDGGSWALGGLVRKYADGGEVQDFGGYRTDPSVTQSPSYIGGGQSLSPALRQAILQDAQANGIFNPTTAFQGAGPRDSYGYQEAPQETLPQMAAAYASPEMDLYTQEYQAARQRAAEDRARFEQLLQASLDRKDETGPSKAEMYFQLAAAFGAPTKTGSFGESLAGANTVLAGHQKGIREANLSAKDRKDKLALEVAKYRADGSKDDLSNLRTLAVEEMKARRQGNLPLSEAGKMVYDTGRRPGQPGYAEAVNEQIAQVQANKNAALAVQQGNANLAAQRLSDAQAAAKLLTPAELKLKTEAEDTLAAAQSAMKDLDKAFVLNQNAYDNSAGDWVAKTLLGAAGSEDPKVVNTREMNNLLTGQGLTRLRATFGGNPTEGERAILLELQGIGSKSQPEREAIMKNAYRALKAASARQEKRLADINSRAYREVTPPIIVETQ